MGLFKIIPFFVLPFFCWGIDLPPQEPNHIVYLMHAGDTEKALKAYQEYRVKTGSHDFELIERLGLILLDQGYRSKDEETQLLALFGAGISTNEKALYIIEGGLTRGKPELELIALNFIERYHNDRADQLLHKAMSSDQFLVRLEAALLLASKKDPKAIGQIEALMAKVPEELWSVFPQLLALIDNPEAKKILRKMLSHPNEMVRIAAILSIAQHSHDDFLPAIRRMSAQHEPAQQEACAAALGILKDENSSSRLLQMAKNSHSNVSLAALQALYGLGREEVREEVEKKAKENDLFAISLLGSMQGSENVLAELLKSNNLHVKANAAIGLLDLRDSRCLPILTALLLNDMRDIVLVKFSSPGKTLETWKVITSAKQNLEDNPVAYEMSLHYREDFLIKAVELPEKDFLTLANAIFETQQNDLIPVLIEVLENHPTPGVIALLKKHQQKAGAPLVRNYCNLALYRLKQPGPYANNLREWVTNQRNVDLIRFRPLVPWDLREKDSSSFELTPQETSRLLVEAFESFVITQDDKGIDMLISIIQTGNSKNKYALIGLLMRAIQ